MDRPATRSSAATSMRCWAAPRSWAPTSVRSIPRWPPASPAAPRSAPATTAIFRCMPPRCSRPDNRPQHLIVTVRDVTGEMLQQQKLAAIHQAGVELADLTPDELSHMTVEERIELLKSNILHFTKDLLNFDVVEIRLLDAKTGKLEPLLSVGLTAEAANRDSVCPAAEQRRDRFRRGHGQELSVRGHDGRSAVSGGLSRRQEFVDRAAGFARRSHRHLQRREPRTRGPSPKAICSSWRFSPATWPPR